MRTRFLNALAALALAAGTTVAAAGPVSAVDGSKGTPGYCPNANGVTVIVDFQELGGTTIIRCAPGDQATGHAALKNAGFEITGTNRWGEAFVCRIEGKPGASEEPCIDTPPASAYWGYWYASNGGNWTYSQWGVMNRKPPPGSFEGWSFAKNKSSASGPPPDIAPVRPAAPPPPGGGDGDDGNDGDPPDSGGPGSGDSNGSGPGTGIDDGKPGLPGLPGGDPSASAGPSTAESAPGPGDLPSEAPSWTGVGEDGLQHASDAAEGGIPGSTIAGVAVVALLAVGGGVVAWRRKHARHGDPS